MERDRYKALTASSPARRMWEYFLNVSDIPRPSGHEEGVRKYLVDCATSLGWGIRQDRIGNVVFSLPGRGALAGSPTLILQGHMDMVCEKDRDVVHDFLHDPLRLVIDGDWVRADGTTLGADNGIAIAMAMAAAEADLSHRVPLELLFTIDEETGLTGAMKLDPGILTGRQLINLDSEEEGVLIIGCAGGQDMQVRFERSEEERSRLSPAITCRLEGCRGGHSGVDIHEGRANAIVAAAAVLERLRRSAPEAVLVEFSGGSKKNVIPRDAEFTVSGVKKEDLEPVTEAVAGELKAIEPRAAFALTEAHLPARGPLPWKVIDFIKELPNGVIAMDPFLDDLVHTSSNLGVVTADENGVTLLLNARSSEDGRRDEFSRQVAGLAQEHGGEFTALDSYPGWAPNRDSKLLRNLVRVFEDFFGSPPSIKGIHAGLEAGIIGSFIGSEEIVSFGPTIENAHSPGEGLHIKSAEKMYSLLERFISTPAYHEGEA